MSRLRGFRLIPDQPRIPFVRYRYWAYALSGALVLLTLILVPTKGLNLGIDFRGGILIEVGMPGPADLATMRATLGDLGLGEVALQEFGDPATVLIRIERQAGRRGGPAGCGRRGESRARRALRRRHQLSPGRIRRPQGERGSALEWQPGDGLCAARDPRLRLVPLRVAVRRRGGGRAGPRRGHNHRGVRADRAGVQPDHDRGGAHDHRLLDQRHRRIYDRVRENLRRYKAMPLPELIDRSVNETLARTVMTSLTTLLALIALAAFGGPVIRGFTDAMIWGVVVGTYSTVYVAAPMILHLKLRREIVTEMAEAP